MKSLNASLNETGTISNNSIVSLDTKHDLSFQLPGCNCTRTLVREYEYKLKHPPIKNIISRGKKNRFKIMIFLYGKWYVMLWCYVIIILHIYVDIELKKTTCSLDAFFRGPRQKVVTFSFYGDPKSDKSKARGKRSVFQMLTIFEVGI